jgi:hypothetical protein
MSNKPTIEELFNQQDQLLSEQLMVLGEDYVNRMLRWDLGTKRNKIGLEIGERIAEEFKTWVFRSWNRRGYESLRRGDATDPVGLLETC